MVESKATSLLRGLVAGLPSADAPAPALPAFFEEACRQGLVSPLLSSVERGELPWVRPLGAALVAERRRTLARTLAQCELGARAAALLAARGLRALPLKGVVVAETVCDVESDRPMSDTDLLLLDGFGAGVAVLREAGFTELLRADHAWAFRDPTGGLVLELHRSLTSAPGLFPFDPTGLWARRRAGRRQQPFLPSPEDVLLQLALHAAFQHGLVLTLVQWLDFRRLLEREALDWERLLRLVSEARAETALAAALIVAEAVVAAPFPPALEPLRARLPGALRSWLAPRLAAPLGFVAPAAAALGRVRWLLLAARRRELLWRTLVLPETPDGDTRPAARLLFALRRAARLARGRAALTAFRGGV